VLKAMSKRLSEPSIDTENERIFVRNVAVAIACKSSPLVAASASAVSIGREKDVKRKWYPDTASKLTMLRAMSKRLMEPSINTAKGWWRGNRMEVCAAGAGSAKHSKSRLD
jgi:hypothetical protein